MCSEKEILKEIMTTPKNVLANQILALVKRIDRDKETYNALAAENEKLAARVAELEEENSRQEQEIHDTSYHHTEGGQHDLP